MRNSTLKLIKDINNGQIDMYLSFFNSYENIFKFLESEEALHLIDFNDGFLSDYINYYLNYMLNIKKDRKIIDEIVVKDLWDVIKKGEDYYLKLNDLVELSTLFKSYSRDLSPHDVAKSVLGDDDWEPFYDTVYDIYNDVIEELNEENLNYLKQLILRDLPVIEVDEDFPDLLVELSDDGMVKLNEQNINQIISDSMSTNFLLDTFLEDMKYNLMSVHNHSYNSAYHEEYYNKVNDELSSFFDMKNVEWVGSDILIKINSGVLYDILSNFVSEFKTDDTTIEYHSYLLNIIVELMGYSGDYDYLDFYISDYPDYSLVVKNINEIFGDYL